MLSLLQQRLENIPLIELRIAASEQNKITNLRLKKMLADL
jgi:2-oxo-4-hydroxy-4-carboxy--5-ureidoimidazoline (OHCU) decarboxylase